MIINRIKKETTSEGAKFYLPSNGFGFRGLVVLLSTLIGMPCMVVFSLSITEYSALLFNDPGMLWFFGGAYVLSLLSFLYFLSKRCMIVVTANTISFMMLLPRFPLTSFTFELDQVTGFEKVEDRRGWLSQFKSTTDERTTSGQFITQSFNGCVTSWSKEQQGIQFTNRKKELVRFYNDFTEDEVEWLVEELNTIICGGPIKKEVVDVLESVDVEDK